MASASPGYAVAVPVQCPTLTGATSQLTTAVTRAGDSLTALDVVESEPRPASNFDLARQVFRASRVGRRFRRPPDAARLPRRPSTGPVPRDPLTLTPTTKAP